MTDAPLSEWQGVTADADGNMTALQLPSPLLHLGVVALAEALPGLQITALGLGGNQITDAGAAALAEALPGSQVKTLALHSNPITGPWLQRVLDALHATLR